MIKLLNIHNLSENSFKKFLFFQNNIIDKNKYIYINNYINNDFFNKIDNILQKYINFNIINYIKINNINDYDLFVLFLLIKTFCKYILKTKLFDKELNNVYNNKFCENEGWYITTCKFNKYLDYCIHRLEKYSPAPIKGILVPLKNKEEFDSYKNIPIQYIDNTQPRKSGFCRRTKIHELHANLIGHSKLEYPCRVIDADLFINEKFSEIEKLYTFRYITDCSWILSFLNDEQKWLWNIYSEKRKREHIDKGFIHFSGCGTAAKINKRLFLNKNNIDIDEIICKVKDESRLNEIINIINELKNYS